MSKSVQEEILFVLYSIAAMIPFVTDIPDFIGWCFVGLAACSFFPALYYAHRETFSKKEQNNG